MQWLQILMDSLHPRSISGLLQFSQGEAVKILASDSSGSCTMWPHIPRCTEIKTIHKNYNKTEKAKFTWMRVRRLASALWCDGLLCLGIFIFCTFPSTIIRVSLCDSHFALVSDGPAVSGEVELLRERDRDWVKHRGDRLGPQVDAEGLAVTGTIEEEPAPVVGRNSKVSSRNEKSVWISGSCGRPWTAVPKSSCETVEKPFVENWLCSRSSKFCWW